MVNSARKIVLIISQYVRLSSGIGLDWFELLMISACCFVDEAFVNAVLRKYLLGHMVETALYK